MLDNIELKTFAWRDHGLESAVARSCGQLFPGRSRLDFLLQPIGHPPGTSFIPGRDTHGFDPRPWFGTNIPAT